MHQKFKDLLHEYKKEVFHAEHDKKSAEEIAAECLHVTEEVLETKFHYHFHKVADAERADIINMINNYTREAILPPLVDGIVSRQVLLERRIDALVNLIEHLFELFSSESQAKQS